MRPRERFAVCVLLFAAVSGCSVEGVNPNASAGSMRGEERAADSSRGSLAALGKQPDVVVVDATGKPVAGATVMGISLTIGGQETRTDANGHAGIPWAIQETKWIVVKKPGYETTPQISVEQAKPIRITLQSAPPSE